MKNFKETTRELAKFAAETEDSAVAQYIKAEAEYLTSQGKDLSAYSLVRIDQPMEWRNRDTTLRTSVVYKLVPNDKLAIIPEESQS